jgi:PKD repeat protein
MTRKKSKLSRLFQWIEAKTVIKMPFHHLEYKYLNLWVVLVIGFTWCLPPANVVHAKDTSIIDAPAAVCDSQTEIPVVECAALEDFYQSTGGENWLNHTGWLASLTPCSWSGVLCQAGHVVGIWFDDGNNLQGSLPASIGEMSYISTQTITLAWTPIEFDWGDGGYAIEASEGVNGPFRQIAETNGKDAANYQVTRLNPDTDNSFRVRTHSARYEGQQNDLMSDYTPTVSARTYATVNAGFEASDQIGIAPMLVTFTNHSSGDPYQLLWDFGDGVTSTLSSPQHIYAAPGIYSVSLSVTGDGGSDSLTRHALIQVYEGVESNLLTGEALNLTYATQGITTTLSSPPQSANGPVKLMFVPEEPRSPAPLGYQALDFGFWLAAVQGNQPLESYQFYQPFQVSIDGLSSIEALSLMAYREGAWYEAACPGFSASQEVYALIVCRAGHYALFEKEALPPLPPLLPQSPVFLPLVQR